MSVPCYECHLFFTQFSENIHWNVSHPMFREEWRHHDPIHQTCWGGILVEGTSYLNIGRLDLRKD